MDLNQIKQILDLVREHELSEFEIEHDGLRLKIRKDASRRAHRDARGSAPSPVAGGARRRGGAGAGAVRHRAVGRRAGR